MSSLKCVFCNKYLGTRETPRQAACGERLCGKCLDSRGHQGSEVQCPVCCETIVLAKCFRDRAVEQEVASLTIPCGNEGCPWKGSYGYLETHASECRYALTCCPNDGCTKQLKRAEMKHHCIHECAFKTANSVPHARGNHRGKLRDHRDSLHHVECLEASLRDTESRLKALEERESEVVSQLRTNLSSKLQPLMDTVTMLELSVQQLRDGFNEMALIVQTLQATSYNGRFTWKIPEVVRRRSEAVIGKTVSLYSAPFYTGRHGYKMCLRLYLNGDGSGKGTHLSFFLTIMRGEYDPLLLWPFRQTVTMMLLDQDKRKDIVQSFRPEPTSSSFQRPVHEMNVASGCPVFAPTSVLANTSYVKDDAMFLRCTVDCNGLEALQ